MFEDQVNQQPPSRPEQENEVRLAASGGGRLKSEKKKFLGGFKKFPLYFFIIATIGFVFFSSKIISSNEAILNGLKDFVMRPFQFLTAAADRPLKGEDQDRVNILLLGVGGLGHDGGYLSDTIMVASYKPSTKQVALLSIPRDLTINMQGYGYRKINSADALGEIQKLGTGPEFASQVVSNVLGIPIDYYVRADFSGFQKLIDDMGGVDIYVENTFDDYRYPIKGKELVYPLEDRFEHLHFDKGWTHMDGTTALKYVRSRHALGIEGSDFARSRRQQNVMLALKQKVFSVKTLIQPSKIAALINSYQENINTNLQLGEMIKLASLAKDFDNKNVINKVLDDSTNGALVSSTFNGIFILEPKVKDGSQIKDIAQNIFSDTSLAGPSLPEAGDKAPSNVLPSASSSPLAVSDKPRVEILNGTKINGLGKLQVDELQTLGFDVLKLGNFSDTEQEHTAVYDLSQDKYPLSAQALADHYDCDLLEPTSAISSQADFVVVLGADQKPPDDTSTTAKTGQISEKP